MASSAGPITLRHNLQGHHDVCPWSCITDLSFSSLHSHVLASGSEDKTVALWDTTKGELLHRLSGHQDWVNSVCFEPNSHVLASGSEDKTVALWDAHTGQLVRSLPTQSSEVFSVRYSPLPSPGGAVLAVGFWDGTVSIWDRRGEKCVKEMRRAGEGHVVDQGFSRDGALLGLGLFMGEDIYSDPGRVELWDTGTWRRLWQWKTERAVTSVTFASQGSGLDPTVLAAGIASKSSNLEVVDAGTGKRLRSVTGHTGEMNSVHFAPDKGVLVSASTDSTVRFWDCGPWTELHKLSLFQDGEYPSSERFSADGSTLAVGGNMGSLQVWDVSRLRAVEGIPKPSSSTGGSSRETRATAFESLPQQAPLEKSF